MGPESIRAAEAAECAGDGDKFWEYHDTLFDKSSDGYADTFGHAGLVRLAESLGLHRENFDNCLLDGRYAERVRRDFDYGSRLGVRSTPTVFINGVSVIGLRNFKIYQDLIDSELSNLR